jgi:hypothetical protein
MTTSSKTTSSTAVNSGLALELIAKQQLVTRIKTLGVGAERVKLEVGAGAMAIRRGIEKSGGRTSG